MIKILYDHQMFSMQKFGGVTRYFADLIFNLPQDFEKEVAMQYSENHYITKTYNQTFKTIDSLQNFRIKRRLYYFFNHQISKKTIKENQFDVFHPTYYNPYFLKYIQKPFVITVHDMIHERFPDFFPAYENTAKIKKILINKANHIIAVSQNTKKDIVELLNINPDKITVVYHGYNQQIKASNALYGNYILFVGERKSYKNFYLFLEAIVPLLHANKTLKVICTGKAFTSEEIHLFQKYSIFSQLIAIQANDSMLYSLYQNALVFVFPSLYEGFGIPILEAFANNCPVCLSNTSCFPEIAQDAAQYFDPTDKISILDSIQKVISNKEKRNDLISKGKEKIKYFSINEMVSNTCKIYQQL
ncbi:MAG: glycosyltransferase family 1 protein [Bacteroidales bacterium]|jgi:glycosyltransferase involved in cell wall biosynthesis|nr:glycosyltransferase family 1 protein [Bacteroidales bacterium]MDD3939944.1 glycosyltransferase family 1 protein [Patescibacteria group bacterium]MDD4581175.1 glycosyltransferase family 1 protein [Bacteroidales bacterium]